LYKPEYPKFIAEKIAKYTKDKLPAFFEYAKDKKPNQVCTRNNSFVNKIYNRVKDKGINIKHLGIEPIDYKLLMRNPDIVCSKEIAETYDRLNKRYRFMLNMKDEHIDNLRYVACRLRDEFAEIGYSNEMVTDMLVEYLYGSEKRYKQVLWFCYGQYIVNNLSHNIVIPKKRIFQCASCGEWFEVYAHSTKIMCDACAELSYKERYKKYNKKRRK